MLKPFQWQIDSVELLVREGRILVQAPPGQGKSLVAKLAKERVGGTCLLIVHQTGTIQQWKDEWGIDAVTVQSLCNESGPIVADLVVLDESHRYESSVWSQIHARIQCKYLLGLSATPGESCKRFSAIYVLPWAEAKLPSFVFVYHKFGLEANARIEYEYLTKQIQNTHKRVPKNQWEQKEIERERLMLCIKRRRVCHASVNRRDEITKLLPQIRGKRTLVVSETIEQAEAIAKPFGVKVVHSKAGKKVNEANMAEFKDGRVDMLSSVRMLKEGFNCPDMDTLVVASSALTDTHYVQLMGRALRFVPGKTVQIHVFIASGTSDETLIGLGESITGLTDSSKVNEWKYGRGIQYSFDHRRKIFTKGKDCRIYYEPTGTDIEDKLWQAKPGGRFSIYKGEVLVKPHGKPVVSVGFLMKELIVKKDDQW